MKSLFANSVSSAIEAGQRPLREAAAKWKLSCGLEQEDTNGASFEDKH